MLIVGRVLTEISLQTDLRGVEASLAVRRQCESPGYDEAPRSNLRSVLTVFVHMPQVILTAKSS